MSSWAEGTGRWRLRNAVDRACEGPEETPPTRRLSPKQVWLLGLVAALLALLYATNFAAIRLVTGAEGAGVFSVYPAFFAILFVVHLAAVRLTWFAGRRVAVAVILLGVLFRLSMLPTPVVLSSDLYRYFWDGRVQLAGINPYRHPPQAHELSDLRGSEVHSRINRPWARTVYPPGAQMLFAALALTGSDRLWPLRILLTACDVVTMVALVALLRRLGLPEGRVAAYAWAPLPLFEFAQAGHIDAAVIPLVLGALLAVGAGRSSLAGGLLGGAALIKLYPASLLPVLWTRGDVRVPAAFFTTVVLGYLPYTWGIGWRVVGFLPEYFMRFEEFNIGLRALLTDGIGLTGTPARLAVSAVLVLLLIGSLVRLGRSRGDGLRDVTVACGVAVGAYLFLLPSTMHPWYVAWLIPFLVVLPNSGAWYFTGAVTLSYVAYTVEPARVPAWALAVEYVPVYLGVLLGLRAASPRCTWFPRTPSQPTSAP